MEMTPDDVVNTIKASGAARRGGGRSPSDEMGFTKRAVGDKKLSPQRGRRRSGRVMDPLGIRGRSALSDRGDGDSPHTRSGPIRATSISARNIRLRWSACKRPSRRRVNTDFWGTISSGRISPSTWRSVWAPARSSAAKRPRSCTSIEGHRGEPRPRPPFPANKGLFSKADASQ